MRRLLHTLQILDLVESVEGRREAAMDAEHGVVHNSREAQAVKDVRAVAPHIRVAVLFEALVVEAVDLRDLPALVVAANQRHPFRVANFEAKEHQEGLH